MAPPNNNCVLPHALNLPSTRKLAGKRVVLASASPRRAEILRTIGIAPEIVPSTFGEDLDPESFEDVHEYPVATAQEKAVEVYLRLVESDPENPPDLVIGADTVVLTHPPRGADAASLPGWRPTVLEKPRDKDDQLRMLLDFNGGLAEVVTGVAVVWPVLVAPGWQVKCIDERTLVHFADHKPRTIKAYVDSGEGLDRAGGFAIQGTGGLLVRKVDGDYANVVGFPAPSFVALLEMLVEDEDDFLTI
jgi:septum formation protein